MCMEAGQALGFGNGLCTLGWRAITQLLAASSRGGTGAACGE